QLDLGGERRKHRWARDKGREIKGGRRHMARETHVPRRCCRGPPSSSAAERPDGCCLVSLCAHKKPRADPAPPSAEAQTSPRRERARTPGSWPRGKGRERGAGEKRGRKARGDYLLPLEQLEGCAAACRDLRWPR